MYGTLAGWRAHAAERGGIAPTVVTDEVATAALVRVSNYIRFRYVVNLAACYDETLPTVEQATYVAASLELATPGFFSKTYTEAEQKVLTEVKGIKWTVTGKSEGAFSAAPTSTIIEAMFAPYVAKPLSAIMVV